MTQLVKIQGPNLRDQSKGQFHVHTANCGDNRHYGYRGRFGGEEPAWAIEVAAKEDCESFIYDFAPVETPGYELGDYLGEFWFAPCVKNLPQSKESK